ncbi:MAG TPA: membrane lipoprotein lipid attachment site-containing protein, partial [Ferruginibacter sp.]|nr:membrane lipoprotein lipid attachment site-containing protein [Ferruginibacter sp.]
MKNILFAICGLLLLTGCNNTDDAPTPPATQSFNFDNNTYSLLGSQGITEARMQHVFDIDGVFYNRSNISLIGLIGFSRTATVSFDLYYKDGMSVGGTYTIYQEEDDNMVDFQDYLTPLDRAC